MKQNITDAPAILAGVDVGKSYLLQSHVNELLFIVDGTSPPAVAGDESYWLRRGEYFRFQRDSAAGEIYVWGVSGGGHVFYKEAI